MGTITTDEDYGYIGYRSDNGLNYELLVGETIGGSVQCTSDICFVVLDEVDLENADIDRLAGYFYGATNYYDEELKDGFIEWVELTVRKYELKNPQLVEMAKERSRSWE